MKAFGVRPYGQKFIARPYGAKSSRGWRQWLGASAVSALPVLAFAGPDPGLLLLPDDIQPSMRDVYGAAWFLLVPFFLGLWLLGAEIVVRILSAFSTRDKAVISGAAGAGMAIGASYNPNGGGRDRSDSASGAFLGLLVFGIFMLAMFLFSKRLISYPVAIMLFMMSFAGAADRTAHEMAVAEATGNPDLTLPIELVSLTTNPALVGSSGTPPLRVALRVHNASDHDLLAVTALCSFHLRNGDVAHQNRMTFPMEYRVPPGFAARVESRGSAAREFDAADYSRRVRCELVSGELRSIDSATTTGGDALNVLSINETDETIRIKNNSSSGVSSVELQCLGTAVSGFGRSERAFGESHAGWIRYSSLRREFMRDGEAMIPPNTEETLKFSSRSENYSGDSSHRLRPSRDPMRCDISRLRWHTGG